MEQTSLKIHRMRKDMSQKLVMMRHLQDDFGDHDHHFFELAYVTSGTAEHILNGNCSILKPGDFSTSISEAIIAFIMPKT